MSVKQHLYPLLSKVLALVPHQWIVKPLNNTYFLPFYHLVADKSPSHIKHLYPVVDFNTFETQLDRMLKMFEPLSLQEFIKHKHSGNQGQKPVMHLTIDDGLKECVQISEILYNRGIPATFFINSEFMNGGDALYRYKVSLIIDAMRNSLTQVERDFLRDEIFSGIGEDSLQHMNYHDNDLLNEMMDKLEISRDFGPIYLNEKEIKDINKKGFDIGGHSLNHPNFADVSIDEQKRQVKENMDDLQNKFDLATKAFAFPFTDDGVSTELLSWMKNELKLDIVFGTAGLKTNQDGFLFQRFPVEEHGINNIKSEYFYFYLKKLLGRNGHRLSLNA